MTDKPEIKGGPQAHALAWMLQEMQRLSGSPDMDIVELDKEGNEVRRVRLKNVELLKVEVHDAGDVQHEATLKYDNPAPMPICHKDACGSPCLYPAGHPGPCFSIGMGGE